MKDRYALSLGHTEKGGVVLPQNVCWYSLQGGISRFYDEIRRLKQVIDLTQGQLGVLFLLDEFLQGTNSHDRRLGAKAMLRSLVERGAIGLVTTHDLALAEIAEGLGTPAANAHFEDRLEDGKTGIAESEAREHLFGPAYSPERRDH
jgi:hypothetical protein